MPDPCSLLSARQPDKVSGCYLLRSSDPPPTGAVKKASTNEFIRTFPKYHKANIESKHFSRGLRNPLERPGWQPGEIRLRLCNWQYSRKNKSPVFFSCEVYRGSTAQRHRVQQRAGRRG